MLQYGIALAIPLLFLGMFHPRVITRLGPNGWIGIRMSAPLKSPEAWEAAHERAWPTIRNLCLITLFVCAACIVGTSFTGSEAFEWIALGISVALVGMGPLFVVPAAIQAAERAS